VALIEVLRSSIVSLRHDGGNVQEGIIKDCPSSRHESIAKALTGRIG
jgi:hypothetical protein